MTRTIKADLHNHWHTRGYTWRNGSERFKLSKIANTIRKKLGAGGTIGLVNMACGDDENASNYERVLANRDCDVEDIGNAFYVPEYDVLIVKAEEVPTNQGHLLVLGIEKDKHMTEWMSFEDTLKQAEDFGGVKGADHFEYWAGAGDYLREKPELLERLDFLEIYNNAANFGIPILNKPFPTGSNKKAQEFYESIKKDYPNLGAIATSDSHSPKELGRTYTLMQKLDRSSSENLTNSSRQNIIDNKGYVLDGLYTGVIGGFEHFVKMVGVVGEGKVKELLGKVKGLLGK